MAQTKKEIDNIKINAVYHKGLEKIGKAFRSPSKKSIATVYYNNRESLFKANQVMNELSSLRDKFDFNDSNEKLINEKADNVRAIQSNLCQVEDRIKKHVDIVNEAIIELDKFVKTLDQETYSRLFLD